MERAMYSSTEIDRIQDAEKREYLKKLEEQGLTLYKGEIVDIDLIGDRVQMEMERELDCFLSNAE